MGDATIATIESDNIMTTSHALVLDKLYPQLIGEEGALVAIPMRHLIIAKRLDSNPSPQLIKYLQGAVRHIYSQNQYALSDKLCQYKDRNFVICAN